MSVWRELHDTAGGQTDLANELNVDVEWLANRIYRLRRKYEENVVPKGKQGNPGRKDEP